MSETRKRSRKSKLEVRVDDSDFEIVSEKCDETIAPPKLQKLTPKPELSCPRIPLVFDHDYCKQGFQGFAAPYYLIKGVTPKRPGIQPFLPFAKMNNSKRKNFLHYAIDGGQHSEKPNIQTTQWSVRNKITKKRNIESMIMLKYNPDNLFAVSADIAAKSSNPADKVLDIEIRNLWGNILQTPDTINAQEAMIQMGLISWQMWAHAARSVRESPLFYQCHICNLSWWRLQPFREHLQNHEIRTMKILFQENGYESMVIASYKYVSEMKYIDIKENCWRCGKNVKFHKNHSKAYSCTRCSKTLNTCYEWSIHESACIYTDVNNFNIDLNRQCTVCKRFMDTVEKVEEHMVLSHTVRSDIPVPVTYKECTQCESKYFTYSAHNCPKSVKNSPCDHCCRKFATKPLALAHMLSLYNRPLLCRFCDQQINTKCQEMEHIAAKHSDKYKLVYRCTICSDQNLLYVNEESIKKHKIICHHKKTDRRRGFYELMLVPKVCVETNSTEVLIQTNMDSSDDEPPTRLEVVHDKEIINKDTKTVKNIRIPKIGNSSKQSTSNQNNHPLRILTVDVNVTVDEVDIKKEPIGPNGEVDYEEMLHNMFKQDSPQKEIEPDHTQNTNLQKHKDDTMTEFDYTNVKIKTEPIDEIEIEEHPIELVKVKSEPIDESEEYLNYLCQSETLSHQEPIEEPETLTVKVEPDIDIDEMLPEDIIIKNEIDETDVTDEITSDIPLDLLNYNSDNWADELNPDEMSLEVQNPNGLYKTKKVYACNKCGYTAEHKKYKIHLKSHCSITPGPNNHPCSKCGLKFHIFRNYVLHFETHGYEPMICPKCSERFDSQVKLISHVQKHIKNGFVGLHLLNKGGEESSKTKQQVKCQECREAVNKKNIFIHWERHLVLTDNNSKSTLESTEEKRDEESELTVDYERVTMNNKKLDSNALRLAIEHLESPTTNDKECVICYRAFHRRYDVKRHLVEHLLMDAHMNKSEYKSFRCQICFEDFQMPDKYKFHMREHAAMPIFKCEICNKTFSDSSNFAKHKKTHNVRVMICDICRKKFHSRAALVKHIADHSISEETQCAFCEVKLPDKVTYKRHKYQVHTKHKYKCILCDLSFVSSQQKWNHDWEVHQERKQNADCPICLKSFRKFQDVRTHARTEHAADLVSTKSLSQIRKRRSAECPACRTKFQKLQDLKRHVRSVHRSDIRIVSRTATRYEVKIIPD